MSEIKRTIPENLGNLDTFERSIRVKSIETIKADEILLDHVELVEVVMDHLDLFAKRPAEHIDQETVQMLGARVFNDLASAYGQITRGYYQIAAATLRDVMEILYLVAWFDRDPEKITEWRESDDATRKKIFAPWRVRKFLDDFDGFTEGKRGEAYILFCEYASHATWKGFSLMRPSGGGKVVIGPFFDEQLMKASLEEMAQLAAQIGNYFAAIQPEYDDIPALETSLRRFEVTSKWAATYHGRMQDYQFIADMKAILRELKP